MSRVRYEWLNFETATPAALALADRIERASRDAALYVAVRERRKHTRRALFDMDWIDLMTAFLDDPTDRTGWVVQNSLAVLDRKAPADQPVRMEAKL